MKPNREPEWSRASVPDLAVLVFPPCRLSAQALLQGSSVGQTPGASVLSNTLAQGDVNKHTRGLERLVESKH